MAIRFNNGKLIEGTLDGKSNSPSKHDKPRRKYNLPSAYYEPKPKSRFNLPSAY